MCLPPNGSNILNETIRIEHDVFLIPISTPRMQEDSSSTIFFLKTKIHVVYLNVVSRGIFDVLEGLLTAMIFAWRDESDGKVVVCQVPAFNLFSANIA